MPELNCKVKGCDKWWMNNENRLNLGEHLLIQEFQFISDTGEALKCLQEYYEKPWKYDAEWEEYQQSIISSLGLPRR